MIFGLGIQCFLSEAFWGTFQMAQPFFIDPIELVKHQRIQAQGESDFSDI